jgi:hypothetical protein
MEGLVDKIAKKIENDNQSHLADLAKTSIFTKLINKYETLNNEKRLADTNLITKTLGNEEHDEDELPHFGTSSKKIQITETYKNTIEEECNKVIPMNPNNTMNKNESQIHDDSIFNEDLISDVKISNKFQPTNQLDNIMKVGEIFNTGSAPENMDSSSFFQNTHSLIIPNDGSNPGDVTMIDEYVDDDDPGFDLYECEQEFFRETCKKLSEQYDFPRRATYKSKKRPSESKKADENNNSQILKAVKANDKKGKGEQIFELEPQANSRKTLLPSEVKFMESGDTYYPIQYNNVVFDCFNLKVIVDRERTGFEESKEFKVVVNSLIAGRYQVLSYLGSAAFSKAIKVSNLSLSPSVLISLKINLFVLRLLRITKTT